MGLATAVRFASAHLVPVGVFFIIATFNLRKEENSNLKYYLEGKNICYRVFHPFITWPGMFITGAVMLGLGLMGILQIGF